MNREIIDIDQDEVYDILNGGTISEDYNLIHDKQTDQSGLGEEALWDLIIIRVSDNKYFQMEYSIDDCNNGEIGTEFSEVYRSESVQTVIKYK